MALHQDRRRKGPGLVSVEDGRQRLGIVLKVIQQRKDLRPGVEKRLCKDVTLFKYGIPDDQVEGRARQQKYINFLGELRNHPSMLILCMVGLGLSVVAVTRDEILVDFADAIKRQIHIFDKPVLHEIATKYLQPASIPESSNTATRATPTIGNQITTQRGQRATEGLGGDVYELSLEDLKQIIASGHLTGSILLTDTYGVNATPFITVGITNELTDNLITNRPKVPWINPRP